MLSIFTFFLFFLSVYPIPTNLEMNVLKVGLSKEDPVSPSKQALSEFYDSLTFNQLVHHKIKHYLIPLFGGDSPKNDSKPPTSRQLSSGSLSWTSDEHGLIMPPWHPRDFSQDFANIIDESQKAFIKRHSEVTYLTEIQIGYDRKPVDVQFSLRSSENILLSTDCKNCSLKGDDQLLEPDIYCLPRENQISPVSNGQYCSGVAWVRVYELIDQKAMIDFNYLLLSETDIQLQGGGIFSLQPRNNIASGILGSKLTAKESFSLHYKNDLDSGDDSYIMFGAYDSVTSVAGYEIFPLKVFKGSYILLLDGLIARKGGYGTKSLYGLQDYDTILDDSNQFISFPAGVLSQIIGLFEGFGVFCYIDAEFSIGTMICDKDYSYYPIISIVKGGREINLDPTVYGGRCFERSRVALCLTKFAVNLRNQISLGEPFFINTVVNFDLENDKIGISYPQSQTIMDWSLFDNTFVMFAIVILFAGLIILGIACAKEEKRKIPEFNPFLDEQAFRSPSRRNIEMKIN